MYSRLAPSCILGYEDAACGRAAPDRKNKTMAVPKKKVSKSRRDQRRAHDALKPGAYEECPECGEIKRPHHVCPACGQYNGREVVSAEDAA